MTKKEKIKCIISAMEKIATQDYIHVCHALEACDYDHFFLYKLISDYAIFYDQIPWYYWRELTLINKKAARNWRLTLLAFYAEAGL